MIRQRAAAAGIETKLGNHSFRATGITAIEQASRFACGADLPLHQLRHGADGSLASDQQTCPNSAPVPRSPVGSSNHSAS
jgi:hypothetical protein